MNSSANVSYLEECSMGTQTETKPKMTYKELKKQPILVRIIAQLEIYNSDGGECEYRKIELETKTAVPEKYKNTPLGQIENINEYQWANHLQVWMIARRKRERAIIECGLGPVNGVEPYHYRYTIKSVKVMKNKKYKEVKVEPVLKANEIEEPRKMPRQRRPKPMDEIPALAQEKVDPKIELNRQMENIQKQMEEIQGQKAEAEKAYITACLQHAEARKAVEETLVLQREANWNRTLLLQKDGKIKTELENVKKELGKTELEKKQNKNGYIVLAHDDYGGKEEVCGHAQTFTEAKTIANEALKTGKGRKNINGLKYDDDCIVGEKVEALWNGDGKWYSATITKVYKSQLKYDVEWDDQTTSCYLHEKKIKKLTKIKRFNSARIVDLDTQIEVEEFGKYIEREVEAEEFGEYIESW